MDRLLSSDVFNNIKVDTLKFGTAEAGKKLAFEKTITSLTDTEWLKSTFLILAGFAVYQLAIRRVVSTDFASGDVKLVLDDFLKVGTMLVFKQLVETRNIMSLNDDTWKANTAYTLLGLATYDFLTRKVYDTSALTGPTKGAVDDVIKFGTVLTVSQLLARKSLDSEFFMVTGGYLAGLVAYHYFLSHI